MVAHVLLMSSVDADPPSLGGKLLWPLTCPIKVTSTFGEYRHGHFHGGVDFSTFGLSGEPLMALAPCTVYKVRVDNRGYGNTLTLLHDDGHMVSYAHMKRFAPPIEACVREMQRELGHCLIEFYPPRDLLRFAPGDTVGYSGSSGVGPPHLHMEVSSPRGDLLNPLVGLYTVSDSVAPTVYRVVLSPLSANALIDGRPRPLSLRVRKAEASHEWEVIGSPHVSGDIGLSVRASDRIANGSDRTGLFRLRLEVDGEETFRREYVTLPADQVRLISLVYDEDLQRRGFGRCERLYRFPGDDLRLHEGSLGDGVVRAGPGGLGYGAHSVDIYLEDAANNYARVVLPLVVNHPPEVSGVEWSGKDTLAIEVVDERPEACTATFAVKMHGRWMPMSARPVGKNRWALPRPAPGILLSVAMRDEMGAGSRSFYWGDPLDANREIGVTASYELYDGYARVTLKADRDLSKAPDAFVAPGSLGYSRAVMWALDERTYCMELLLFAQASPGFRLLFLVEGIAGGTGRAELFIPISMLALGSQSMVASDDGCAWIEAGPDAVFRDTYLRVDSRPFRPAPGLEAVTLGYRFVPETILLKRPVLIGVRVPPGYQGTDGLGIFRWEANDCLRAVPGSYDAADGAIKGSTRELGTFVLLRDPFPPTVSIPYRDGEIIPQRRTTSLKAYVADRGSGVDQASVQMYLDGVPVPACPEGTAWVHRSVGGLTPGDHTIRVEARDAVGNDGSAEARIAVR